MSILGRETLKEGLNSEGETIMCITALYTKAADLPLLISYTIIICPQILFQFFCIHGNYHYDYSCAPVQCYIIYNLSTIYDLKKA